MRYFEDLVVGGRASFGDYAVTREEVLDFARRYDPQPFHLDDDAAAATHFGRLAASGWHTAAMTMAMLVAQMGRTAEASLGEVVERAAKLPLLSQPGREWNYSIATDVLGHFVAVVSGQDFGAFLHERVLAPLGMAETGWHVPEAAAPRFAANYYRGPDGKPALLDDPGTSRYLKPAPLASGGGGLVSTAGDYLRFCRFMLNRGELDGVRLLGRKTVDLMTMNHLGGDLASMGQPRFSESNYNGIGFGLGFSVMLDPAAAQVLGTPGEYAWGGAASTAFWIDPAEEMAVILMTQLTPSSTYPIRRELRVLTYSALVE